MGFPGGDVTRKASPACEGATPAGAGEARQSTPFSCWLGGNGIRAQAFQSGVAGCHFGGMVRRNELTSRWLLEADVVCFRPEIGLRRFPSRKNRRWVRRLSSFDADLILKPWRSALTSKNSWHSLRNYLLRAGTASYDRFAEKEDGR